MRYRETIQDDTGRIDIMRSNGIVFESGDDLAIARACRDIDLFGRRDIVRKSEVTANFLLRHRLIGQTHIIDVSADNPLGWFWSFYGVQATITWEGGRHHVLDNVKSSLLRDYALAEYTRIKETGQADFSELIISGPASTRYRRLILPLREGGKVSHLLSWFIPYPNKIDA